MNLNKEKISDILAGFQNKKILVIGDVMVDAYYWGVTERISPEAPVPIVDVKRTNFNPGGAGNVALNLSTLGADVSLAAVIGNDSNGEILVNQLQEKKINTRLLSILEDYATPIKTRVIAQEQQVIRIDQENNSFDSDANISNIIDNLKSNISKYDGILLADYNKGLLSKRLIKFILKQAKDNHIPIYVDPKDNNFFEYKNVRLFKPNIAEFGKAIGNGFSNKNITDIGKKYLIDSGSEILLITRGADEALLFTENGTINIPTITQSVHDVSGAGDTVIATFALADLSGANPEEAAIIANIAASVVCSKVGVVPIEFSELKQKLLN